MELRHMRYFVAVADEQSFTRAAERLHISQPPLSRQIQDLEEELGTLLFERGSRPLKLTEPGRFFYSHATRLLEQAAQAARATRRVARMERRLVIGFVASTMYGALPRLVRLFRGALPQVEIALEEMSTLDQIEALKSGRIDVGFGRIRLDDACCARNAWWWRYPWSTLWPFQAGRSFSPRSRITTSWSTPESPGPAMPTRCCRCFVTRACNPQPFTRCRRSRRRWGWWPQAWASAWCLPA
jgi:DNA-binding transcriptional LysR family regulator